MMPLKLTARYMTRDAEDSAREVITAKEFPIEPKETAALVCDMWDHHWCRAAEDRVAEMAPVMNRLIGALRDRGVFIVHAPSSTMGFYAGHPARKRALSAPRVELTPPVTGWMSHTPTYEATMPIDDSGGGCPCEPRCEGGHPWTRQIGSIEIRDEDAILDDVEAYALYRERGIRNVLMMGVHLNMCVLGRPFGIRNTVRQGYRVMLVRDMTDTMYDPRSRPWVDHFTGTDLMIRHVETWWCPTVTSSQVFGGVPFRFREDTRASSWSV